MGEMPKWVRDEQERRAKEIMAAERLSHEDAEALMLEVMDMTPAQMAAALVSLITRNPLVAREVIDAGVSAWPE